MTEELVLQTRRLTTEDLPRQAPDNDRKNDSTDDWSFVFLTEMGYTSGAKNATFEPLRAKIDHFARTGSGQMQETVRKMAFFAGLPHAQQVRAAKTKQTVSSICVELLTST